MPMVAISSPSNFTYSCSSVYRSDCGRSATSGSGEVESARSLDGARGEARNGGRRARSLFECAPDVEHAALEGAERAGVVDDEVGARALQLGRHLRGDHLHRFRLAQTAILHQPLEPHRTRRVDENDSVEILGEILL